MRILIVEDEVRLADALGEIMRSKKYTADVVYDGEAGFDYAMSGDYDIIVMDVMMPKMNGFEVVEKMRRENNKTPVILLTAKDEKSDIVTGLDSGADDYLTKPFSQDELFARIRALSRRQGDVVLDRLKFGDISLNLSTYALECGCKSVHLGFKEFEVMRILMVNSKIVVSKDSLLSKIWGDDVDAWDNNVEAYISFLRKKLSYLGSEVTNSTVRKVGYYLEDKSENKE